MEHWKIVLLDYRTADQGEVMTKDGEVVGTWTVDENDIFSFMPPGATEPLFENPFLGLFCEEIAEWHATQP